MYVICRHCHSAPVSRPRGLCWGCYYAPGVRENYPSESKYGRRGTGNMSGQGRPTAQPTCARPGTEEKIAILAARVARREELWHPEDAPMPPREPVEDALGEEILTWPTPEPMRTLVA